MDKGNLNQIEYWSVTFEEQLKYMHALTNRLSYKQFNFKPESDRWSVGECIEHLNLSMLAYLELMEPVIHKTNLEGNGNFAQGTIMGRLMLRALRKPGRHYPAPRSFTPELNELDPGTVRNSFDTEINRLMQCLKRAKGLALGNITMPWPVFHLIKISLAQAFELQVLHNDRHFKQAEQVIQLEEFPTRNGEFL